MLTNTLKRTAGGHGDAVAPCSLPYAETEGHYSGESIPSGEEDVDALIGEVAKGRIFHAAVLRHCDTMSAIYSSPGAIRRQSCCLQRRIARETAVKGMNAGNSGFDIPSVHNCVAIATTLNSVLDDRRKLTTGRMPQFSRRTGRPGVGIDKVGILRRVKSSAGSERQIAKV